MADQRTDPVPAPEAPQTAPARRGAGARQTTGSRRIASLLLASGLSGAVLLLASQFLTLFTTRTPARRVPLESFTVGSAHGWALAPVAVLAAALAYGVWSVLSRPALLAVGVLGAISLVIALARDLSLSTRRGIEVVGGHYVLAGNRPALGLYVETVGAMLLIITCVSGFILLGAPRPGRTGRARTGGAPPQPGRLGT